MLLDSSFETTLKSVKKQRIKINVYKICSRVIWEYIIENSVVLPPDTKYLVDRLTEQLTDYISKMK